MGTLEQRMTKNGQIFPFPEPGRQAEENPPCFSWIREGDCVRWTVRVFRSGELVWQGTTERNFIVSDPLPGAGEYCWTLEGERADGEILRREPWPFTLAERHVTIRRTSGEELYRNIPDERPRHLFTEAEKEQIVRTRGRELAVLRKNVDLAYRNGIPDRPMFHRDPDALPYREYFGGFRDFCDRDLVACSLAFALLGDEKAGAHAKTLFLTFCDWNPAGPCSLCGPWGDEVGLSMARCLPMCFDLLWPLLDDRQRRYAAETVRAYGEQCFRRLTALDFTANPGSSHAGRIPAYLGEAAAVLKGTGVQTEEEGIRWLDYALDVYGGIFPYYGTPDGGWAEGPFYATSYTKWYLPFFSLVERFSGCRFLERPFYQRLTQFFLHFAGPGFENHPFGDGYWCSPEDAEWPGFFAQNPMRVYADRFGPELARKREAEAEDGRIRLLHLADAFLPDGKPPQISLTGEAENVRAFPDAGFVSLHTALAEPDMDFALLARASRFGSGSHRHPDEGSFALFYRGAALVSPSGYFGRQYGSRHHREWCNSTAAHNAILIDGEGQEPNSFRAVGKIVSAADCGAVKRAVLDCTEAYPALTRWQRSFELREEGEEHFLTVTDEIESPSPVRVTWPLHTLSLLHWEGGGAVWEHRGIRTEALPVSGGLVPEKILDEFPVPLNDGEPEEYAVTMPPQYHVFWKTGPAEKHKIVVRFRVTDIV